MLVVVLVKFIMMVFILYLRFIVIKYNFSSLLENNKFKNELMHATKIENLTNVMNAIV